ncbi:MAG: Tetratricopeptide 1 repeat-containing protein [Verrucomicrobiales bacterium]|nr:Tetratricopeptide 1 repeat-containing protein [Verrucomicrobiales bacterium]
MWTNQASVLPITMAHFMKTIFLCLLLSLFAAHSGLAQDEQTYLKRGIGKAEKGDFDGAISDFDKAIHVAPTSPDGFYNRGITLQKKGDFDGALADLNKAISLKSDYSLAFNARGLAKHSKGDIAGASADFNKAIALNPRFSEAYNNRGNMRQMMQDLTGALADFEQAIRIDPKSADSYFNRGHARKAQGDLDGAITDFTMAITLDPKASDAYHNRGTTRQMKGDLERALADIDKAIELKPDASAYSSRAEVKRAKGDLTGAGADFNKSVELDPTNPRTYRARGYFHYRQQRSAEALADFRKSNELNSSDDYVHFAIFLTRARLGQTAAAAEELQKWLGTRRAQPNDWATKVGQFLAGQLAEPDFLKAASNPQKQVETGQKCEAFFYAGMKRLIAGDKPKATEYFQNCLATGQKDFTEYASAEVELKSLKPAP